MNAYLNKYFNDELAMEEADIFFSSLVRDQALKEEFVECHNLLGIVDLLPQKKDTEEAQESLFSFIEYMENKDCSK
ncbi:hypothetical protein GGR21_000216 [Dysgonomonas hofstadii]|uniref:Anti-sigma factor n=1 Tax=Dysgonomonas hofstadii TaxID=637886 RepID=A0A840CGI6_9BACT|nr:anti-sigma factor [Dysgonomonas hofstadii]MBB4034331.1 hypothetical protein [Dysgonomonas hofstadii]